MLPYLAYMDPMGTTQTFENAAISQGWYARSAQECTGQRATDISPWAVTIILRAPKPLWVQLLSFLDLALFTTIISNIGPSYLLMFPISLASEPHLDFFYIQLE